MATWFGITTPITEQTLPADTRTGQQLYTVTNESGEPIRGDAIVVPEGDAKVEWFNIANPSRAYSADGTEQVTLDIKVTDDVGPGTYSYRFRVVVAGGVPEEQFNDGPPSRITVQPKVVVAPTPKPFPWWIVAVVAAIVLALIVGGVAVKACGGTPPPTPVPTPTPDARADLTVKVRSRGPIRTVTAPLVVIAIHNGGATDAGAFTVVMVASGLADQSFTVSGLGAGQDFSESVTLPVDPFSSGNGVVIADFTNRVDETDENNNQASFSW